MTSGIEGFRNFQFSSLDMRQERFFEDLFDDGDSQKILQEGLSVFSLTPEDLAPLAKKALHHLDDLIAERPCQINGLQFSWRMIELQGLLWHTLHPDKWDFKEIEELKSRKECGLVSSMVGTWEREFSCIGEILNRLDTLATLGQEPQLTDRISDLRLIFNLWKELGDAFLYQERISPRFGRQLARCLAVGVLPQSWKVAFGRHLENLLKEREEMGAILDRASVFLQQCDPLPGDPAALLDTLQNYFYEEFGLEKCGLDYFPKRLQEFKQSFLSELLKSYGQKKEHVCVHVRLLCHQKLEAQVREIGEKLTPSALCEEQVLLLKNLAKGRWWDTPAFEEAFAALDKVYEALQIFVHAVPFPKELRIECQDLYCKEKMITWFEHQCLCSRAVSYRHIFSSHHFPEWKTCKLFQFSYGNLDAPLPDAPSSIMMQLYFEEQSRLLFTHSR